ncbi:AAA family ATPase [Lysobacter sp. Root494]|uniref:AAA family ATPase n=1 Tax=Lysobacter sp. Root494 TaxID=1736549 RepID=UPI0006F43416|nr:AAA family ATPase [Lysobacter sp. Root494]KQY54700.1 ATPase [Lysobacter sp. Root494]
MTELQDLVALLRADTPLILIETRDEARVVELFRQALSQVWRHMHRWSITEGLRRFDLDREDEPGGPADLSSTLDAIREAAHRGVYLLFDAVPFMGAAITQRQVREILERRNCQPHVLVLVGHKLELPPELATHAVRYTPQLPDAATRLKLVREEADAYARQNGGRRVEIDGEAIHAIVRNLRGLDGVDIRRIARHLINDDGALGPNDLPQLAKLKFELLNRSGLLRFEYDTARFADVAGARRIKRWVEQRRKAFVADAEPVGEVASADTVAVKSPALALEPPKGLLLLGVQGCGKSMIAKAVAGGFGVPLVRLDFGSLYNKYQGETERNLREALAASEQLEPCVVWIDEIEKGLASDTGDLDGGVSRRVLGYLLTWMAERRSRVFLVATANSVEALPPELLRKGRFDEVFFVDLPDAATREQLFALHLEKRGFNAALFELPALVAASEGFSGAEIEQAIVSAMFAASAANVALSDFAVRAELKQTRPLSVLMAEQVEALREWARERTVPAD